jgi:hypothetical protein
VEGVALDPFAEGTEIVDEGFGVVVEVDENEALPDFAPH